MEREGVERQHHCTTVLCLGHHGHGFLYTFLIRACTRVTYDSSKRIPNLSSLPIRKHREIPNCCCSLLRPPACPSRASRSPSAPRGARLPAADAGRFLKLPSLLSSFMSFGRPPSISQGFSVNPPVRVQGEIVASGAMS